MHNRLLMDHNQNYESYFNAPQPSRLFTGRTHELDKLKEIFESNKETKIVQIIGCNGIGKSELVKKFISSLSCNVNKIWLNGSQMSSNCPLQDVGDVMSKVVNMIQTNKQNVIVIDDAKHDDLVIKCIQNISKYNGLVITTATKAIKLGSDSETIILLEWNELEAVEFITKVLGSKVGGTYLLKFTEKIGTIPLHLVDALGYIRQQKRISLMGKCYGIENYLDELSSKQENLKNVFAMDSNE